MANNTNNTQEKKDQPKAEAEAVKKNNVWSEEANKKVKEELKKQK